MIKLKSLITDVPEQSFDPPAPLSNTPKVASIELSEELEQMQKNFELRLSKVKDTEYFTVEENEKGKCVIASRDIEP